ARADRAAEKNSRVQHGASRASQSRSGVMTPQAIAALVHSRFPDAQEIPLPPSHVRGDESYLLAPAASILPLGDFLRRDESLSFDNLSFLTAIDWKTYFEVVYYLVSTLRRHKLVLKVKLENRAA